MSFAEINVYKSKADVLIKLCIKKASSGSSNCQTGFRTIINTTNYKSSSKYKLLFFKRACSFSMLFEAID